MSVQELRAESMRRGLGTARARADLIQRLTDDDAAGGSQQAADAPIREPDGTVPGEEPTAGTVPLPLATAPGVFRQFFPVEDGGPDEETHLANRQTTLWAAKEAGWQTRGDARLTGTVGDRWVYEVSVRQVT